MKRSVIAVTILAAAAATMLLGAQYQGSSNLAVRNQQAIAKIQHGTAGTVWFVAIGGNDAKNGLAPERAKLSPKTTIEAAVAYDVVTLGPGTFALGDAKITVPANVAVIGAGIDQTVITSTGTLAGKGPIVTPGNNSSIRDLTILGVGSAQAAFGSDTLVSDAVATNVLIERVKGQCDVNGLYLYHAGASTITARDCQWVAADGVRIALGASVVNPGADDEAHVQCTAAFAEDAEVDAVVVGLDPLSPAMRTLAQCGRGTLAST